jgi:hypothetical protein
MSIFDNIDNLWKLYFPHDNISDEDERLVYIKKSSIYFEKHENSKKLKVINSIKYRKI